MITWRDVTAEHVTADVSYRATPIARLHARPTRWQLEDALRHVDTDVQMALRST